MNYCQQFLNSLRAFFSIKENREAIHTKIEKALEEIEFGTFRQIARHAHLQPEQVHKRLSEMRKKSVIRAVGSTRCKETNKFCTIYKLNDK